MTTDVALAAAYSATGGAWQRGPGPIYDRLADVVVERCPVPMEGSRVLDVGAGTGAVSRSVLAAGAAAVVAVDASVGMLAHDAPRRPPAAVGDVLALPFAGAAFDAAVAAFSLTHVSDPAAGLREMARVTRPGGGLVAASYADDDGHPVKVAVEEALGARGWAPPPWYAFLRDEAAPRLATLQACVAAAAATGLDAQVEAIRVPFPDLGAHDLVAWRLGLAQHAPFLALLAPDEREAVAADAVERLGGHVAPLVRSILVLRAVRP